MSELNKIFEALCNTNTHRDPLVTRLGAGSCDCRMPAGFTSYQVKDRLFWLLNDLAIDLFAQGGGWVDLNIDRDQLRKEIFGEENSQ